MSPNCPLVLTRSHLFHLPLLGGFPTVSFFVLGFKFLGLVLCTSSPTPPIITFLCCGSKRLCGKNSACTHKIVFRVHVLLLQAGVLIYQHFFNTPKPVVLLSHFKLFQLQVIFFVTIGITEGSGSGPSVHICARRRTAIRGDGAGLYDLPRCLSMAAGMSDDSGH